MTRPLLLLHGALGDSSQFASLRPHLEDTFTLHTPDFPGHGACPLGAPLTMPALAAQVIAALDAAQLPQADVFGYSMGGYAALLAASGQPQRFRRIFTLGTRLLWSPEAAARETRLLDPARMLEKVPQFARALAARHTALGWEALLAHTAQMLIALGENPPLTLAEFAAIRLPVRLAIGDRDTTAGLEETLQVYRALPEASLQIFPSTPHPLDRLPPAALAVEIKAFFNPGKN